MWILIGGKFVNSGKQKWEIITWIIDFLEIREKKKWKLRNTLKEKRINKRG